MSVIIRLQGLSWSSSAMDVRNFFQGLTIPPGGVHIIGGEKGDAFIAFSTDEDARQAMMRTAGVINENPVQLFLSSKTEMHNTITEAKQQSIVGVVTPNPAQAITKSTPTLTSGYPAPGIQITSVQQQQQPQANQFQNVYTNNMYNAASDSISWNTLVANEKTNNANEQDLPGEYSVGGMPSKQKHDQHAGYGSKEYTVERGITQTPHPTNKDPKSHTVPAMDACTPRYGQQVWDNLKPSGYQFQQQNWIENQHQEHIPHNINNMQAYNPHLFPPQEVTIPNKQNIKSFDQFGMPSLPVSTINAQTSLPHIASLANTPIDMPEIGPDIQPTILKSDPVIPINNDLFKENLHKIVPVTSSINRPLGSHKLPLLLNIPTTSSSPLEGQQLANATQNVEPQRGFGQFGPPDISHNLNKDGGSSDTKEKQATSIDISDDKERKDKDRERDKDRRDRRDRDRDEDRHRREHDRDRGDRDRGERDRDRDRSRRSRDRDRRRDNDRRNSPRESLSSGRSSRKRSLSPPSQSKADVDKTQQTKKSKDIAISSSFDNDSLQSQLTTHAMVSVTASSTMNLSESLYGKPLFPSADVNSFSDESKHGSSMGILGHAPPEFPIRGQIPSPVNNNNNSGSGQIHDQHQNTDWIVPPPDADDLHFKMHDDGKTRNFEEIHNAGTEGRPPGSGLERWVNDIGDRPGIDRGSEMHGSADRRGFDNGVPRGSDRRRHEMERIHGMEHQLQDMGGPPRLDMQEHDMRGPLVFDRLSLEAGAPGIHGQKNEVAKPPGMNRQRLEMGGPSTMGMRMHDTGGPTGMDRRVNDIGRPVGIDRHGQELIGPPSMEKRGKEMVATPGMGRQGQDTGGPPGRDRRGPEIGGRPDIDRRGLETGGPPGKGRRGPEIGPPGIDMRWPEMRGPSGMDRRRPEMEGSPGTDRRGPEMGGPPGIDRQWPEIGGPLGMNRRVPEMGGPPGMDRPGPDMGGPPGMDRQGPKMGGPPVTDRRGPEMGGPPGIDRRGPAMGGPPGMDIRGPEMGGPSGMHRRGPDMGGPPGMDRRRPEMVPPAMDRRGPEMGGPPGMDRRGPDIGGPPGMDRRRPDMGPPSMDRRGPEMGGPPGMDRRGPDMGGPPGMDRRRPEMGPPAMDRRGSEIGGPPGMNRQGPEMRGPPGMDRRGSDMRGPPGMERREPEMGGPSDMDRRGPEMGGRPGMDRRGPEMGGPPGMDRRGPEMGGPPGMDRRGPEIGGPSGMHRRGPEIGGPPGMDRREPDIGEPLAMDRRGYDMGEPQSLRTPGVKIGGLSDIDRHGNPMKGPLLLGKRGNEMGGPSISHGHEKEMGGPPHIKDRQGELTRNPMLGRQGNDTRRPPDIRDVETRGPPGIDRVERVRGNEMVEPPGLAKREHVMELQHHRDGREDMIVPLGERNAPDIGRRGDDMGGPPGRMDRRENERFDMRGPPLLGRRPDEMGGPPDRDYWMIGDRGLDHRERQKGPPGPDRRVQEMGDQHILQRRDNEMQIGRRTDDVNEPPWSERRMDSGRGKADWIEEEHNSRRPSEERDELRRQEHESDKQGWRRRENIGSREHDNWPNRRGRWEENGRNFRERGNDSSDSNSRYDGDRGRGRQLPYGNRCRSPIREIHLNEKEISSYSHGRRSEHERSLDNRKDTRHCDDNRREKAERPTKGHDRSDKRDDMTNKNDHSVETRGRVEKNVQLLTGKANDNLTKNKGDSKDIGKLELNNDPDENEVKKDKNIAETNSKEIETNKLYAVHLRGLELTNNYRDIRRFLLSSEIPRDGIKIINDEKGNRTGQAYVKFTNSESFKKALSMDSKFCGINKVLVCSCSDKEFDAAVDSYIPEEVSDDENTPHGKAIDDANSASDGKSNISSTAKTGNDSEIKQMKPLSTSGFVISKPKEFIVKVSNLICNITHLKLKTLFIGCIIARNGDAIYIDVDRKKPGASANAHIEFKNAKSFGNALQVKKTMDRKDILVRPSTREELESVIEKNKTVNPKQYEQYMADMKKKNNCSKDSQKIEGEKAISTTAKSQNDGVKQDKPEDTKADTHLTCIQLSNLPLSYNSRDVRSLLDGFEIASRGIQVCHDAVGKPLGEGYVNFTNSVWANKAMKLTHGLILGRCKLSCKFISVEQMIENCRVSRKSLVPEAPSKQAVFFYVKASNLPKNVSIGEIMNYFDGCRPAPESMRLNIGDRSDGPDCSTALIGFWSREDAEMAISKTSGKLLQDKIANLTKVIV